MTELIEISQKTDIPSNYLDTPIGDLLEYHNLGKGFESYISAKILIGMCIDNRKSLKIPDNFAFIIRAGGANLQHSNFKVSYTIGVGGVSHIAIIGHNNCGMSHLIERKKQFINGLVQNAGWEKEKAEEFFDTHAPNSEIGNEIAFVLKETDRLRQLYPRVKVAPVLYKVENGKLYLIKE